MKTTELMTMVMQRMIYREQHGDIFMGTVSFGAVISTVISSKWIPKMLQVDGMKLLTKWKNIFREKRLQAEEFNKTYSD